MISTGTLAERIADPTHTILDVRPMAAYNGWALRGEPRGGHLPGAKSIPLEWTRYMDWVEVVEEKRIPPDGPVTIYGYTADEADAMADRLTQLGFENLYLYHGFVQEWSADPDRPLRRLERYRRLVHPQWLHDQIHRTEATGEDGTDWVLCHAHFGHPLDYAAGHIPGALPLDTNWLESPDTWNRRSEEELKAALGDLGIRHDMTVVLYGRYSYPTYEQEHPGKSAGHLAAMRCAALMLYAGVEDVRILNGGIHSWEAAGYELSTSHMQQVPARDFGVDLPARPEYMLDSHDVRRLLASEDGVLADIRSWLEFIGQRSGYHYIEAKGRIPGAVFGNCGRDAYHMDNYRNFDYTTREFGEIAEKWAEVGIVPDRHVAFFCGTGWRASEAFMNAWLMGWPRISVYDGGWYEWIARPDASIETGPP